VVDVTAILSLSHSTDRRAAARATAGGAALFYGFGNFCALAAMPDRASVLRINRLKGRPLAQAGSVTSDPPRMALAFDWSRLPRGIEPEILISMMADFQALGPIGFRGPAAAGVPDYLTVAEHGMRTVQHISPGVRCRSNALVRETLDLTGENFLFITSANRSSHRSRQVEPAHYEMRAVASEFGHRRDVVMIGHDDEVANRHSYPRHLPCSTSIVAFHRDVTEAGRPALVFERHGSLGVQDAREVANRHGFALTVAPGAHMRLPVRWDAAGPMAA
jgi:hypothetical protein